MGDIALTAMGYSESERCLFCPCMPASQILFFIMLGFLAFNCYRLGVGVEFVASCGGGDEHRVGVVVLPVYNDTEVGYNETGLNYTDWWLVKADNETATYLGERIDSVCVSITVCTIYIDCFSVVPLRVRFRVPAGRLRGVAALPALLHPHPLWQLLQAVLLLSL